MFTLFSETWSRRSVGTRVTVVTGQPILFPPYLAYNLFRNICSAVLTFNGRN